MPINSNQGIYVYGIVNLEQDQKLRADEIAGVNPQHHLFGIKQDNLCAVVSNVDLNDFGESSLPKNLEDVDWVQAKARLHQEIIGRVMKRYTVLPFKFGIIFTAVARVRQMLEENQNHFQHSLNLLKGKEEWGVKVYCHPDLLKQNLSQTNVKIVELREEMAAAPAGKAFFMKKQLENLVSREVEKQVGALAADVYQSISKLTAIACQNKLVSREITGKSQEMILNAVFLLARTKVEEFIQCVHQFDEQHGAQGFDFEYSGPWPAFASAASIISAT